MSYMDPRCKAPTCEFSKRWNKCVKPNAYNEALAWCKRNNIPHQQCRKDYNSVDAKRLACKRYEERMKLLLQSKSKSQSSSKAASSKSSSKSSKKSSSDSFKTPPEHPESPQHVFLNDAYDLPKSVTPITLDNPNVQTFMQNRAANKIIAFFKSTVLRRSESLANRINYYKSIQYFLRNVQYYNCLVAKRFTDKNGVTNNGFEIDTILKLTKQIGSKSVYGVIYQTAGRSNILSIASKLMPVNQKNKLEVILNTTVTHLVINNQSKHFLISYKTFKCTHRDYSVAIPPLIRGKEYYVTLNELALGDLKMLCTDARFLGNDVLMYNICMQCFLTIYTFHCIGYSHNDCHYGNFLYHMSKNTQGYFHYVINGANYYLKNVGYNMMIYDFGLAQHKNAAAHYRRSFEDYRRILKAFRKNTHGGWIDKAGYPSTRVSAYMDRLDVHISDILIGFVNEDRAINTVILQYFMTCPIPNMFLRALPPGATVANSQPFIIDRHTLNIATINPLSSPL
jgi:hypothetical protein